MMAPVQRRVIANGFTLRHQLRRKHRAARRAVRAVAPGAAAARPRRGDARLRHAERRAGTAARAHQHGRGERRAAAGDAARSADRRGGCRQARQPTAAAAGSGRLAAAASLGEVAAPDRAAPRWRFSCSSSRSRLRSSRLPPRRSAIVRCSSSIRQSKAAVADAVLPDGSSPRDRSTRCRRSRVSRSAIPTRSARAGRGRRGTDSAEAMRFKAALKDTTRWSVDERRSSARPPVRRPIDIAAARGRRLVRRSIREKTMPAFTLGGDHHSGAHRRAERRGVPRGAWPIRSSTSRCTSRCSDLLGRALPAEHRQDPAEHDHAARNQPALHRSLHGRAQPRVRARAALARVSDRPARQLLPPVLGSERRHRPRGADARRRCARSCATSRRSTPGRCSPSSATTIIARSRARTRRKSSSSSAASCSRSIRPPSSMRRRRAGSSTTTARSIRAWNASSETERPRRTGCGRRSTRRRSIPTSPSSASISPPRR